MNIISPGYSLVFEGVTDDVKFREAVNEFVKTSKDIQNTNIPTGKESLIFWNSEDEEGCLSFNADLNGYQFHKRVGLFDSLLEKGLCRRFVFVFSPGEDIEIEIVVTEKSSGVVRHWFQSCSIDEIKEESATDFDDSEEFKGEWEYDQESFISTYIQELVDSFDPTAMSIWIEMK